MPSNNMNFNSASHIHDFMESSTKAGALSTISAAASAHTHVATDITNSTAVGRSILTAADIVAQRTILGLGSAALQSASAFQPVDSDLTAIASLVTNTFGRGLLTESSASTTKTTLGFTTVGDSLATLANPSAITFLRINANNTVSALTDTSFRTAAGLGTGDTPNFTGVRLGTSGFLIGGTDSVSIRNGSSPQGFDIYNTYTNDNNNERGFLRWSSDTFQIGTSSIGTGYPRGLQLLTAGLNRVTILSAGSLGAGFVGINNTSPTEALHVVGNVKSSGVVYASGGNSDIWNSTYMTVSATSATSVNYILAGGNSKGAAITIGTNDNFGLNLETNSTTRMSIASSGLVSIDSIPVSRGIGTNTFNIAIGGGLVSNTTGGSNTAIGADSLRNNTTGANNTAIGGDALRSNTVGVNNVAVGTGAMTYAGGSSNVAIGVGSLSINSAGSNNIAVGNAAFNQIESASGNIGIGSEAGNTTVIPWMDGDAELNSNVNSSNALVIGNFTKVQETNQTNQVVIGHYAEGSGSNTTTFNNISATSTLIKGISSHVLNVTGTILVSGNTVRIATPRTPASATATGIAGEISWDSDYLYVCNATNSWKRIHLGNSSW
jgi:hypothetical protein